MPKHINDPFNLIEISLLNKIKYSYLNKPKTEIKFLPMVGINKRSFKANILFEEKNNFTTLIDTATTLPSNNITSSLLSFLVSQNSYNVLQICLVAPEFT